MIKFFGLLCLVGLASACCMVSKWEAFEGFTVGASKEGQGSYTEGGLWLSYDEDRKMMNTFLSESTDGKARKVRVLQDYSQHIQYTLDELTSRCTKMKLSTSFQKACVPAGAKLVGNQYFGAPSSNFNVDVYKIPNLKGLEGYLLVTQNGCIPVSEGLHGEIAEKTYGVVGASFSNYTEGIKSASVFDVPTECQNATVRPYNGPPTLSRLFL